MQLLAQRSAPQGTQRWGVQPSRVGTTNNGTVLELFANFRRNNTIVRNHSIVEPNTPLGSFVCTVNACPSEISQVLSGVTISAHCDTVADGATCVATCDAGYSDKTHNSIKIFPAVTATCTVLQN